jgi:hypothetical protein
MKTEYNKNKALSQTSVRRCFAFLKSDEYPNGAIKITKEDALKLQKEGWEVNFHTENYLNFIGCNFNGLEIGFCNWMTNLDAIITTPEVGYYGDSWLERVKFKSQDCLDNFVDTISNLVWLSKNNA